MKRPPAALLVALLALVACARDFHRPWHDVRLPSGGTVKVTQFLLVWGAEHDERFPERDCLAMEYVSNDPQADDAARRREALAVFELMRPTSELWGFDHAEASAFPTTERKGRYDLFLFQRGTDGSWSVERRPMKVFVND